MTDTTTRPWTELAATPDLRLVVLDMDGTLLREDGTVPEAFWDLLPVMQQRDIVVVPASGRQYATLHDMFGDRGIRTYLAENGTVVVHDGEVVATSPLSGDTVQQCIAAVRGTDRRLGLVVCTPEVAYVESTDREFLDEAAKYYHSLKQVEDLTTVQGPVVKVAVFAFGSAEDAAPVLFTGEGALASQVEADNAVVISGANWIDIMLPEANKGSALHDLQEELGISRADTAVFGDYLNDLEMVGEGDLSFAMANAHPGITAAANYVAPANTEDGVVQVLRRLLG
ncbi:MULTISPECIES: HAD family hydrolase [unclassified Corynebacterium]|uniref:HAD family hydrolase n=1 Tax=unclassified Corynebacterium TaxID=2624378 RepID=UPI0026493DCD|nr:HAD family hydrolase [Corynebacterium sp.]MDN5581553.1 Cof-type HAD-IIB family hydrolase [Corynebacterium sp.]MDN5718669.1 Cof-type HAD-IIB family hydrolase [Corynebacterium sp.]MDN6324617.1 Cof-type HAD-IIB family hydrolase [Corynebacterium sp.]MDN6386648.1 Cof-type HAD-IIB family hydrolase [Corynebacterium sp.]MDN6510474.1 Cof-type HAD-IIB family hydrolase [Corynebacterium sp.]